MSESIVQQGELSSLHRDATGLRLKDKGVCWQSGLGDESQIETM